MSHHIPRIFRPATPVDCATCPARHIDLFAGVDRAQRAELLASFHISAFEPKEVIYNMGHMGEFIYIVRFGLIKLVRYSSSGVERIVGLARTGDNIGMASLVSVPYRRTAVAMSRSEVCRVPAALVRDYNRGHPEFVARLLEKYQATIDLADTFLTDLSTGAAHARVARLLLFLTEKSDHNESPMLTRDEMGALLGLTTETTSRVIAEFRRAGLIQVLDEHHDRCRCDVAALARIAAG